MDAELRALCTQKIHIEPFVRKDGYGKDVYGASVEYACHLSGKVKMISRDNGQVVMSTAQATLDAPYAVSVLDRFVHPNGTKSEILAVRQLYDEAGAYATIVYTTGT